jgi:1-acyl-sn-glycerol-3-phosphate acyltransferase
MTTTRASIWFLEIVAVLLVTLCGLGDPLFWPVLPWPYALWAVPVLALALVVVLAAEVRGE